MCPTPSKTKVQNSNKRGKKPFINILKYENKGRFKRLENMNYKSLGFSSFFKEGFIG